VFYETSNRNEMVDVKTLPKLALVLSLADTTDHTLESIAA
jgi:hypothetical protein